MGRDFAATRPMPQKLTADRVDLEGVLLQVGHCPFMVIDMVLGQDAEGNAIEAVVARMSNHVPAGGRQVDNLHLERLKIEDTHVARFAASSLVRSIHRSVDEISP